MRTSRYKTNAPGLTLLGVLSAAALALGACGGSNGDSDIDISSLDTGDYPTTLRDDVPAETDSPASAVQRLADYVALPYEIDPSYDRTGDQPLTTMTDVEKDNSFDEQHPIKLDHGWDYGLNTSGYTTASGDLYNDSVFYEISHYRDADSAAQAAKALGESEINRAPVKTDGTESLLTQTPAEVPGHPEAVGLWQESKTGSPKFISYSAHGEFVIRNFVTTPEPRSPKGPASAAKTIEVQNPLLDAFAEEENERASAASGTGPEGDEDVAPARLTLPPGSKEPGELAGRPETGEFGPRGYTLTQMLDQRRVYTALDNAGVERVGYSGSDVLRASDADKTSALVDELAAIDTEDGWSEARSPEGFDDTTCLLISSGVGRDDKCFVTYGRYVGIVTSSGSGSGSGKDLRQAVSAQYVLLRNAAEA